MFAKFDTDSDTFPFQQKVSLLCFENPDTGLRRQMDGGWNLHNKWQCFQP